jgi:glutaconate CoA-transferase subunit A
VLDATCPAVYAGLQAGAKGQPFAPLRGLIGSDLLRHRARLPRHRQPLRARRPRDPIVVVPAINTDLALFHATLADSRRQCVDRPRPRPPAGRARRQHRAGDGGAARARQLLRRRTMAAGTIPAAYIDALAVVPGGCWPMDADGRTDLDAVRRYQQAARSDERLCRLPAHRGVRRCRWPAPGHRHDAPGR